MFSGSIDKQLWVKRSFTEGLYWLACQNIVENFTSIGKKGTPPQKIVQMFVASLLLLDVINE